MSGSIVVDGNFSDWVQTERIENPSNLVVGYALFGTVQSDRYLIGIEATAATDPVIAAGTTIWLNTDQNTATGYTPFGSIGADYNVTFDASGIPYLYTGAAGQTLVSATPLTFSRSPDGKSLEIAIPRSLVTPAGGRAPTSINVAAELNNVAGNSATAIYLPGDYSSPEYTITDPATLVAVASTHKVAIVYSDTSAGLYFSTTAYSDLIMAAENQARMAGVSYDLIDESKLTSVSNLLGYSAIIFPAMPDVNTAQLPAIISALTSAVYNYHIGIITAGDFLTNDQTGAALPGNAYANMTALIGLARTSGGSAASVTVTANDVSNPILQGYTAGQIIQTLASASYSVYQGVGITPDVLVNQNVAGVGTLPGVVQTTTGGTNVQFATPDLLADTNLLSNVIQKVVLGAQPGVTLHESRQAGIVAVRVDMDQAQFTEDVSPVNAGGAPVPGIYDIMIPILQNWARSYNFVGSYYLTIGDTPNAAGPGTTNWAVSTPYYKALLATGGEIGNHSYTHLISPPTIKVAATTTTATLSGSTQITLATLPSFAGITVGMIVTGLNIGANTPIAGVSGAVANTIVTAVSGNTITLSYVPGGFGAPNSGVLGAIPAGTTLTFGVPAENTNFLQTATGTVLSSSGHPFTYDYEFNQSKILLQQQLGITIYGAAVPGANETYATDQSILPYYQSVAATATTPGYTGYLTGGWTGVGSGYPSAIGTMSPTDTGAVYIAPNMTFDFTEIQYQGKTVAQAEADWAAQFAAIGANAAGTPVAVLPVHDYGIAAWNTNTSSATGSPYATQMYTDFIASAYSKNYEFLTLEQLAARTVAQQKATINYTTVGTKVTATITPDPTAPDLGGMALSVVNGGTQVIQNVTNWYAYNAQELFLPANGGTFAINLGTTQDDVTHIANLPSRADLVGVTGDGTNLNFSMTGDGQVVINLKNPAASIVSIQGAPTASLTGNVLNLTFADVLAAPTYSPSLHTVAVEEGTTEFKTALNDIIIGTSGNDILTSPGNGHNTILGNGGADTIVFSGVRANYSVVNNIDASETVTDLRAGSPDGTDTLVGIANVVFATGATADFNGDNTSDILLQDTGGTIVDWTMKGAQIQSGAAVGGLDSSWRFLASGDLNGDGKSDLLWQNTAGTIVDWTMNGAQIQSGAAVGGLDSSWRFLATGDLNGDGKSDLLWQNTDGTIVDWTMNGAQIQSGAAVGGLDSSWKFLATADFNGDGKSDLLWQNTNGTIVDWTMNGAQIQSGAVVAGLDSSWKFLAAGDLNGDGKADLLWQNLNGTVVDWTMNGAQIQSGTVVGAVDSSWKFLALGDFNGDGKSDLLWQNAGGTVADWTMNGAQIQASNIVSGLDNSWKVLA